MNLILDQQAVNSVLTQHENASVTHTLDQTSGCGHESGLISVDQALQMILDQTQSLASESIPLSQSLNRYLAKAVYAEINLPMFSQSAVDGYAICASLDVQLAGTEYILIGEIRAGQTSDVELEQGQAIRIFTGAKIPDNTTTVARQEIVKREDHVQSKRIILTESLQPHADIRDLGEEVAIGQVLANVGQQLSVGAIAALSMAGVKRVDVFQYPKIAVVITGDEVAQHTQDLGSGQIFDANAPLIEAWFQSQNQAVTVLHVEDREESVITLFNQLKNEYDLILTTGGVSVGDYDFVRPVALAQGFKQIFWKVKQKPGKPMLFADYQRQDSSHCYLLGLPGNPGAVYVGMQVYVSTLIQALQAQKKPPQWLSGTIQHDLKADARERFLRMSAQFQNGCLQLNSLSKQQSHMLSNLMQSNCLVRVPAGQKILAGDTLQGLFI